MRVVALLVLVALVAAASATATEVVTVTNCQDAHCNSGCQNTTFKQDQCLRYRNKPDSSVELSCFNGPSVCVNAQIFSDAQCTNSAVTLTNVCNSCQNNYTLSCGALHGALFWAVNCTDTACQDCGGAVIVPFNKCTYVNPVGYVIVANVYNCKAVNLNNYEGTTPCTGNSSLIQYANNKCVGGTIMNCHEPAGDEDLPVVDAARREVLVKDLP